jgi:hypothetical protein
MTQLWNRQSQLFEPAELFDRIHAEDVTCFQDHWLPPMQAKIDELKLAGQYNRQTVGQWNLEDAHWGWPAKFQSRAGQLQWASYALRCSGMTQGLMFVNLVYRCRLPSQLNQHMLYVDLVSTAPWNRHRLTPSPLYGGVGMVLVTEAILRSEDEGFDGRVGLHSLPGAETLYRDKLGMDCLGPDPAYNGLLYFEMTPQRAAQLLPLRTSKTGGTS